MLSKKMKPISYPALFRVAHGLDMQPVCRMRLRLNEKRFVSEMSRGVSLKEQPEGFY